MGSFPAGNKDDNLARHNKGELIWLEVEVVVVEQDAKMVQVAERVIEEHLDSHERRNRIIKWL